MTPRSAFIAAGLLKQQSAARRSVRLVDVDSPRQAFAPARHEIIREVASAYPMLSLSALGRLFGGRNHSTIGYVLGRYPSNRHARNAS